LQLFSRYSYIWSFNPLLENSYELFTYRSNLISLRLINFLVAIGMLIFLFVDTIRLVNYSFVFFSRIAMLSVNALIILLSYRWRLTSFGVEVCMAITISCVVSFALVTSYYGDMPPFFLSNLFVTIFVFFSTISGLRFRHSLLLDSIFLIVFFIYAEKIHDDPFFKSQYPNLISLFLYSVIAGIVMEYRRRRTFLNYQDLAEQKKMVEDLSKQKNRIISILSHDVASPLNSLSGLLQLQQKGYIEPGEMSAHLKEVSARLQSVSMLLQNLVRWSKSQLEGFKVDKKQFEVTPLLKDNVILFEAPAHEKNLTFNLQSAEGLYVNGDIEMIRLALRNLTSNAIKFARPDSVITLGAITESKNVVIFVSNIGEPISEEQQKKLFTSQISSAKGTSGESGTGLGLIMTDYFVHLNSGRIYLKPYINETVTFCIELPLAG
jgi:signal transduction histidine kinase